MPIIATTGRGWASRPLAVSCTSAMPADAEEGGENGQPGSEHRTERDEEHDDRERLQQADRLTRR